MSKDYTDSTRYKYTDRQANSGVYFGCISYDIARTGTREALHGTPRLDASKVVATARAEERKSLKNVLKDRKLGQVRLFDDQDSEFGTVPQHLEQYGLSPDFRRQLKACMMSEELPVQIVRESTLMITEQIRLGEPGTNPLSDRLWNVGTALFYKSGLKPWKTP
jgi:hypothetical protein